MEERFQKLAPIEHGEGQNPEEQNPSEAVRECAAFHIREKGSEIYFQLGYSVEFLDAARTLQQYLAEGGESFADRFHDRNAITADDFDGLAEIRMENTGKVTGAFHMDFDTGTFSALNILDGWVAFSMEDVCAAVRCTFRDEHLSLDERYRIFLDELHGKMLTADDCPNPGISAAWTEPEKE